MKIFFFFFIRKSIFCGVDIPKKIVEDTIQPFFGWFFKIKKKRVNSMILKKLTTHTLKN